MVINGSWQGKPIVLGIRAEGLTVSLGEPDSACVFSYDRAGRLWTAFLDGISYRRGLDGRIIARWRNAKGERERRWLAAQEASALEARIWQSVSALYAAIRTQEVSLAIPLPQEGYALLERAAAFDVARSAEDARRFREVYKPIGILPPDQYMAVVLQATEGCSFNTCTFCDFYKGRPFHIKSPAEFRAHALAVRELLGEGLSLRRSIFLGDANALVIPMPRLLPLFEVVHEIYDVEALGGIYAFLDAFSGEKKSPQDYAALHAWGLRRVYIGLESGHADLLAFLKKPGTPQDAIQTVRALKSAGVAVGVIVLLGAGGKQYAKAHVRDTVEVLNAMPLGKGDILYLSELITSPEMAYAQDALRAGLEPLTRAECFAQGEAIVQGLRFLAVGNAPRISRYDIREFVY